MGSTLIDITSSSAGTVAAPAPVAKPAAAPSHSIPVGGDDTLIPFKLADIGEGIAEVELMKWYVKVRVRLLF